MPEFHDVLRDWFIEMGYPLDDADKTNWKTLCSGRLPSFWKNIMNVLKSKQKIIHIKKNTLLWDIKEYEKRKDSSAAKLGYVLPPPQIRLPIEKENLQKKLDLLKIELANKRNEHKLKMNNRKQKCHNLHEIKQEIMACDREIFVIKKGVNELKRKTEFYRNQIVSVNKYKEYFSTDCKSDKFNVNSSVAEVRDVNKNLLSTYLDITNRIGELKSSTLSNEAINQDMMKDDKHKYENILVEKLKTSYLCNLITDYQTKLPDILNQNIVSLSQKNADHLKNAINSEECVPLKDNILKMSLFHCQLVIATIQHKKELEKTKNAASIIESELLEKLLDKFKIDMFKQELSHIRSSAHQYALSEEMTNLKAGKGMYAKLQEALNISSLNEKDNIQILMKNTKEKYMELFSNSESKLKEISLQLEENHKTNNEIKSILQSIKKCNKADKILWLDDYKEFQDVYLNLIIKNPNAFKLESDNIFGSLVYLKSILNEYGMSKKIGDNSQAMKEIDFIKIVLNTNSNIQKSESENMIYLNPFKNIYSLHHFIYRLIKQLKFKESIELIDLTREYKHGDMSWSENILGTYLTTKFENLEEELYTDAVKYLRKNNNVSIMDQVAAEYHETSEFVKRIVKNKENLKAQRLN